MNNIDQSEALFSDYKESFKLYRSQHLTESDTRSKLLDKLLNILGWEEPEIHREGHSDYGYYDYLIGIPGFKFIIEAKKILVEFDLPNKNQSATFSTLLKGNKQVISQIRGYLVDNGWQYGVITNGSQFIIGKFINSDGSDWKKNKALLFNGLDDISDRFIEFYNALSKKSIIEVGGFFLTEDGVKNGETII